MLLYHGTSATRGPSIDLRGLLPSSSGVPSREQNAMPHEMPHPQGVYLTRSAAVIYGLSAAKSLTSEKWDTSICLVEVDTDRLKSERFVPDEDWLLEMAIGQMWHRGATPAQVRAQVPFLCEEILSRLEELAPFWKRCLMERCICAHLGAIPREAITRLIYPDPDTLRIYRDFALECQEEMRSSATVAVTHGPYSPAFAQTRRHMERYRFYWRAVQYSFVCAQGKSALASRVQPQPFAFNWPLLWHAAMSRFALDLTSIHGAAHWASVEEIGMQLAQQSGADVEVVRLFALLHDAERQSEGHDPKHGYRAAKLAHKWHRKYFASLSVERLELLCEALKYHADGHTTEDATIGACWDADRLCLGRVGATPQAKYLSTEAARLRVLAS